MILFRILTALGIIVVGFWFYPAYLDILDSWYAIAQTLYNMPPLDNAFFAALPLIALMIIAYAAIMALVGKWRA